jgi:hypothetical protein
VTDKVIPDRLFNPPGEHLATSLADAAAMLREAAGATQRLPDLERWLIRECETAMRDYGSPRRAGLSPRNRQGMAAHNAAAAARAALAVRALGVLRGVSDK